MRSSRLFRNGYTKSQEQAEISWNKLNKRNKCEETWREHLFPKISKGKESKESKESRERKRKQFSSVFCLLCPVPFGTSWSPEALVLCAAYRRIPQVSSLGMRPGARTGCARTWQCHGFFSHGFLWPSKLNEFNTLHLLKLLTHNFYIVYYSIIYFTLILISFTLTYFLLHLLTLLNFYYLWLVALKIIVYQHSAGAIWPLKGGTSPNVRTLVVDSILGDMLKLTRKDCDVVKFIHQSPTRGFQCKLSEIQRSTAPNGETHCSIGIFRMACCTSSIGGWLPVGCQATWCNMNEAEVMDNFISGSRWGRNPSNSFWRLPADFQNQLGTKHNNKAWEVFSGNFFNPWKSWWHLGITDWQGASESSPLSVVVLLLGQ